MAFNNSNTVFNFDHSYASLPATFFSRVDPAVIPKPDMVIFNDDLKKELQLEAEDDELLTQILAGNHIPGNSIPLAQAYAGHQFGHFTMLGDGRAILLGEHITHGNSRFDIQLKGSGQTPYSRRGDGKATLRSMLREYLFSEAIHYLGIPTSRSLAVVATGEAVYREVANKGAVLTRVMKSHIRVGTFEYARYFGTKEDLSALKNYTIHRHFPDLTGSENSAMQLLDRVMRLQIELVVQWMRVGFIHGVLNTDNTSVIGETFDYGPCAFMNSYHPDTVYSSIDHAGRYAFGNQPEIIKWNLAKLAEALLPLIHADEKIAVDLATEKINQFDDLFSDAWYTMMFRKIGIERETNGDRALVDELLNTMQTSKLDYTNTFLSLHLKEPVPGNPRIDSDLGKWLIRWRERIGRSDGGEASAMLLMKKSNPVFVPRNIHVEEALELADKSDLSLFNKLLDTLRQPYKFQDGVKEFLTYDESYDRQYQTFCGT
jgi:serine/tyrosine/threonine adenylyltransferase